jgi:hypothetical protein
MLITNQNTFEVFTSVGWFPNGDLVLKLVLNLVVKLKTDGYNIYY